MPRIYLDHNATTPLHPSVLEAMLPFLGERFGNPSSLHWSGREARQGLDRARRSAAALIGAEPAEIVFTASGTEADNLALRGALAAAGPGKRHLVTSAVEHPAVLSTCEDLERSGVEVTRLPVDSAGQVDPAAAEAALRPDTALLSLMLANNEVGTLQPVEEIARAARERGVRVHCDAVQAAGRVPVDVRALGVDLLSLSGHKIGGPKGVGALFASREAVLRPILTGGSQEGGRRAGTENVAGIVGFGRACELAAAGLAEGAGCQGRLRDRLQRGIEERVPGARANGHPELRLPNTLNLTFPGVDGESLLMNLDLLGIAASTGSACSSGSVEPSHVLIAMGLSPREVSGSIRLSLGPENTEEEVDAALEALADVVRSLGGGGAP